MHFRRIMQIPLELTFHGMAPSAAVEAAVTRWLERLERTYDRIHHCHVWIDRPHRHQRRGAPFQVRIVIGVPGGEITAAHDQGHADVYLAIADAFLRARRQLRDRAAIRREPIGMTA
jgi:putative sigma-54 modulation protein